MEEQNSFQCHYGLCEECIVYLSKTKGALFSGKELEDVMHNRVTVSQVS